MADQNQNVLSEALTRILRPLIRLLMRNGVTYKAFAETAKSVYVEVASEGFRIPGRKQTDSRIAVITGLTRKEVKRLRSEPMAAAPDNLFLHNRAARVISGWTRDPDFLDAHNSPLDLLIEGGAGSFTDLVRRYSGDAPPRAVLDELERVGAIERLGENKLVLLTRAYIPQTDDDSKISIAGLAAGDLMNTLVHNIWAEGTEPYFQRMVTRSNIPSPAVGEFRNISKRRGQQLLEVLDAWLSDHDGSIADIESEGEHRRAGVGIYYFEE